MLLVIEVGKRLEIIASGFCCAAPTPAPADPDVEVHRHDVHHLHIGQDAAGIKIINKALNDLKLQLSCSGYGLT